MIGPCCASASEAFSVTNGIKKGCVLAPTLFSMMFSAMLSDAFQNSSLGVSLRYRTDGKLFNLQRLQVVTKIKETVLRDLVFADNCALNAGSEQEMLASMDKFTAACDNFGLLINTKKNEVMHQPALKAQQQEPTITVKGQKQQAADQFTYLGSTLSRTVTIDIEVNCRIAKASSAFGGLQTNVWDHCGISLAKKLKVYRAVVLTTLMYVLCTSEDQVSGQVARHRSPPQSRPAISSHPADESPDTVGRPCFKDARPPHTQTVLLW